MGIRWHSTRRNGRDGCGGVGDSSSYNIILCAVDNIMFVVGRRRTNAWVIVSLLYRSDAARLTQRREEAAATLGATIQM